MKKSAVLMPPWIGEFVLALSAVSRKMSDADEELTLLVPQHLIPLCTLLSPLPYFPLRRGSRSELMETVSGVKRHGFDTLYLLSGSFSAAWFGMRTGISIRRGMSSDLLSSILVPTAISSAATPRHITFDYAEVLGIPHIEPESWPGVPVKKTAEFTNIVVLCPGSGHGVAGGWEGFRDVVKLLPSYEFVVLGSEKDVPVAKTVASHLPHRVHNKAGKLSIEAAATILAKASVVITNHSGLMHLAGFIGAPVVAIFGSTSAIRYRPLGATVRCATAQGTCTACNKTHCEKTDHSCFKSISPEQVLALAGEIVRPVE